MVNSPKGTQEELEAGARVEPSEKKRNPLDFALWKSAKAGEPAWDSPLGSRKTRVAYRMRGDDLQALRERPLISTQEGLIWFSPTMRTK
jgi:hypothetical protein